MIMRRRMRMSLPTTIIAEDTEQLSHQMLALET